MKNSVHLTTRGPSALVPTQALSDSPGRLLDAPRCVVPPEHLPLPVLHDPHDVSLWRAGVIESFGARPPRSWAEATLAFSFLAESARTCKLFGEWKHRPERRDDHRLDCLVGSALAASIQGP